MRARRHVRSAAAPSACPSAGEMDQAKRPADPARAAKEVAPSSGGARRASAPSTSSSSSSSDLVLTCRPVVCGPVRRGASWATRSVGGEVKCAAGRRAADQRRAEGWTRLGGRATVGGTSTWATRGRSGRQVRELGRGVGLVWTCTHWSASVGGRAPIARAPSSSASDPRHVALSVGPAVLLPRSSRALLLHLVHAAAAPTVPESAGRPVVGPPMEQRRRLVRRGTWQS